MIINFSGSNANLMIFPSKTENLMISFEKRNRNLICLFACLNNYIATYSITITLLGNHAVKTRTEYKITIDREYMCEVLKHSAFTSRSGI